MRTASLNSLFTPSVSPKSALHRAQRKIFTGPLRARARSAATSSNAAEGPAGRGTFRTEDAAVKRHHRVAVSEGTVSLPSSTARNAGEEVVFTRPQTPSGRPARSQLERTC